MQQLNQVPRAITCEFCGQAMPDDPGSHYHRKVCERAHIVRQMRGVKKDTPEMLRLEMALSSARYVGD